VTADRTVSPPGDGKTAPSIAGLRCAIYTRKSTEEGLAQDFNTLVAQREAAEAYVRSQLHAGWTALAEHYDDGGYTGANVERPALRRLLADIAASKIDCVLVYKLDRLSRSLLDFARMMETFEQHKVSLVSITQPLNTTGSLGRLTLNILLSFAEFERTLIQDRTRDKMAAARRKGKWVGGTPVLGYDIAAGGGKLMINPEEARRVRETFALFLEHRSLSATLAEMVNRHWTTKQWSTRGGVERPGHQFTKATLERLLRNVLYVGQVSHQGQVYPGEHEAIVERPVWEQVQARMVKVRKDVGGAKKKPSIAVTPWTERVPRITRLLALALKFEELVQSGTVKNYAHLAKLGQVSRSRLTQMTSLLNLAPDIQEEILFLQCAEAKRLGISEPSLRKVTAILPWKRQREHWRHLRRSVRAPEVDPSILGNKPAIEGSHQ
jgi:DNA invertase Pin-like site-specific DNA recombinase